MKRLTHAAIAASLTLLGIGAASAQEYCYDCYNQNKGNDGWTGGTYWSIYAADNNFNSIRVNNAAHRDVTMRWNNKNVDSADYVAGGGWGNVESPSRIRYLMRDYSVSGDAIFGAYGWVCNGPANQDNIEFYVVERWSGDGEYEPYDNWDQNRTVNTANGRYKIWSSPSYDRANRCNNGKKFHQVWAVRTQKRTPANWQTQTINFGHLRGVMADYGWFTNRYTYLIVGPEGFRNSSGTVRLRAYKE